MRILINRFKRQMAAGIAESVETLKGDRAAASEMAPETGACPPQESHQRAT